MFLQEKEVSRWEAHQTQARFKMSKDIDGDPNPNPNPNPSGPCPKLEYHHIMIQTYCTEWWPVTHTHISTTITK